MNLTMRVSYPARLLAPGPTCEMPTSGVRVTSITQPYLSQNSIVYLSDFILLCTEQYVYA